MDPEKQFELLKINTAEILSAEELLKKLKRRKPLRVKLGIDPSAPEIHLGISVQLRKLKQFQELGHKVVVVVGDFTGMIGDPSGESKTRPKLTREQVKKNMARYKEQIFKILDFKKTEFTYNSHWLGALSIYDFIEIASKYTVARILERDDFSIRLKEGIPVYMHEIMYPLFQAYDSVAIKADIELGGTDQKFNLLVGRELMREFNIEPQVVMTLPILEGTDGVRKMSKSYGNYIGITENAREMFGKVMSIPDELIIKYFELTTDAFPHKIEEYRKGLKDGSINPRDAKFDLAKTIVRMYHSPQAAEEAANEFEKVFTKKELPTELREFKLEDKEINIVDLLVKTNLMPSRAEAKRKIKEGAIDIDGEAIKEVNHIVKLTRPIVIKAGKHKFLKVAPR